MFSSIKRPRDPEGSIDIDENAVQKVINTWNNIGGLPSGLERDYWWIIFCISDLCFYSLVTDDPVETPCLTSAHQRSHLAAATAAAAEVL